MVDKTLAEVIKAAKTNQTVPAVQILRDPVQGAILSKYVSDNTIRPQYDASGNRKPIDPDIYELRRRFSNKSNDINDAETVMSLLPDIELSAQVLISSILSPKDLMTTELSYIPPESICPPNVSGSLTRLIKDHFTTHYKIEAKLPLILRDILYNTGSYPIAIIPENAIDEIINNNQTVSHESIKEIFGEIEENKSILPPKGILGRSDYRNHQKNHELSLENYRVRNTTKDDTTVRVSLEDVNEKLSNWQYIKKGKEKDSVKTISLEQGDNIDTYLQVTDNYEILSTPRLLKHLRNKTINSIINPSLEDTPITDMDIDNLLYRRMYYRTNNVIKVKTNDQGYRKSVGEPLVMHLPSEAVIPIFVPGDPEEHIGYFVLIDENGNPLSKDAGVDYYNELGVMTANNKKCLSSTLLDKSKNLWQGPDNYMSKRYRFDQAARTYADIVEQDLISRLRNGIYGKSVKIGGSDEIYRIMFARSLQQQYTQVLFLPCELMTYMAFKFDDNGMGYSLLDNMKIVNSLAIALMLANVRAGVLNSIPRTKVTVKLDEDDPDSEARREQAVNEYLLLRSAGNNGLPMGTVNPVDHNVWATQANIEFQFTGARDLPDMEIDVAEFASQVPKPDTELEEDMRKRRIMGQGLSPETIDATQGANFATSVVQESILFARRTLQYQELFLPLLSDYISKVTLASPDLMEQIEEIIFNNFDDVIQYLLPDRKDYQASNSDKLLITKKATIAFVKQLTVELPKPNMLSIEKKKEAYENYKSAIEDAISMYISTEILSSEEFSELADKADIVKQNLVAYFCRKWMAENDYLTELNELVTTDEDDQPVFDLYEMSADHGASIIKSIGKFLDKAEPIKKTGDMYAEANDLSGDDYGSYSSDTGSDTAEDTGTGDDMGFDDMGMDMDFGAGTDTDTSDLDGPTDAEL